MSNNNNAGKWILLVLVGGALYVGARPFIKERFFKAEHLELSGKAPKPLVIDTTGIPDGKFHTLSKDLKGSTPSPFSNTQATQEAIRARFHQSLVTLKTPSAPSGSADLEERMKAVTKLYLAKDYAAGIAEADRFLADLAGIPDADPQYKVATAALAMQMSIDSRDLVGAKRYSELAWFASRASQDYLIEKIEPVYYELRGSKVNFPTLQAQIKQLEADSDAQRLEKLLPQAKQITEVTDTLPAESFFRLKGRLLRVYSQFLADSNVDAALKEYREIKKAAEAAGDQEIAKQCHAMIATLEGPF